MEFGFSEKHSSKNRLINSLQSDGQTNYLPHSTLNLSLYFRYVMFSIIGATIWIAGITAWNCIFQMNREAWGILGDNLSAYIPTG